MASHLAGGNMRYDYVGPDPSTSGNYLYKITLSAYRYCGNGSTATYSCGATPEEVYLECGSTGARLGPVRLTQKAYIPSPGERPNVRGAKDVSHVCSTNQTGCEARGGVNGYEAFIWEGNVSVPRCGNWRVTYKSCTCCRNGVSNFTGGLNTGLELLINTNWSPAGSPGGAPANSGPVFHNENRPFPSVCVGQKVSFSAGAYDNDGDSLMYEMTCPWATTGAGGRPVLTKMIVRGTGVTCASPIPGFVMDSITGLMTFIPTTTGSYIAAFYVYEYERCTGIIKGRTYREIQFQVATCANNVPVDKSGISNISGQATLLAKYKMEVCNGELITWDDTLSDPDRGDSIYVETNLKKVMPNAKMEIISIGKRNSIVVRFTWRAVLGKDPVKHFFISFTDDKCDIPGNGNSLFEIDVKASIATGPDRNVCKGDAVFLEGYGNNSFKWKSVYGDPLITGVNWFPDTNIGVDTNKFVKFLPTKTTSLAIEAPSARDLCGGIVQNCFSKDTMKINVSQAYQISMPNDTVICNPASGLLNVNPTNGNLKYTYKWSPSQKLNKDTLKSPTFKNVLKNTKYNVTVTSDSGCVRQASIQVNVTNPFPQNMRAMATDTLICLWDTIGLWVNTGSINYGSCDTNIYPCLGKNESKTVGSGAIRNVNGQNTAPAIYASRNRSVKTQFLYTAADLKARGIRAGPITSIGFNIVQLGAQGANPFSGFTIKMGCSSLAKLSTFFVPDLKVVSDAKSHIPAVGWNTHSFDRDYVWDGASNLIVEVCWDNGPNLYNWDHIMSFDATNYESSIRYYSATANAACNATTPTGAAMFLLPHTKFEVCSGIQKSNYKFQWLPDLITSNGGFISATNTDSTRASVNLTTAGRYKVLVSDTSGVCFDTLFQKITVVSRYNVKPDSLPMQCIDARIVRLTSPTPHAVSKPGGKWTGAGVINDSLGYWSTSKSGIGTFPVTYAVSGNACANSGITFINVVGYPDATVLRPDTICGLYGNDPRHALVPKIPGGYFSGNGVDSIIGGIPPFTRDYFIDGTKFNPTFGKPDTARIKYSVFRGCWNDTTLLIPVITPFDTTYLGAMYHGVPIFTTEFCATSKADTLAVKGKGGTWRSLQFSSGVPNKAMTDTNRGVFNPRLINNGSGGIAYIEVGKAGFCGDTGRYKVKVNLPPEVRILPENFCFPFPGDCDKSKILAADRKTLIKVRVAKFPNRVIDNNNPATYVDVVTADRGQTGWSNLIESDKVTKWDGNPWMIFPYKFEYPFCQLPIGRYPISYTMAMVYRAGSNHPDSICAFTHDTAIYISDKIRMKLTADGDLCSNSSVTLNTGAGSKYSYKWSDGSKNGTLTTSTAGTYTVSVSSSTCVSEDSITLSYCVGLEKLETPLKAQLFPNPTRNNIHLKMKNVEENVTLSIFTVTGQLVQEFKFASEDGKVEADLNVSQLSAGIYSFAVSNSADVNTYRVVIE